MKLLLEASDPDCSWERILQIQVELGQATYEASSPDIDSDRAAAGVVHATMASLFAQTVRERRALLPALFPAFAILCGTRKGSGAIINGDIDWSHLTV